MSSIKELLHLVSGQPIRRLVAWQIAVIAVVLGVFHDALALEASHQAAFAFLAFAFATAFAFVAPFAFLALYTAAVYTLIFALTFGFAAFAPTFGFAALALALVVVAAFADDDLKLPFSHVLGCVALEMVSIAAGMFIPLPWGLLAALVGVLGLVGIAIKYPSWVHHAPNAAAAGS